MEIIRADIEQLARERSPAARSAIAEKICSSYNEGEFSEKEKKLAVEIFRLLLRDAEARVRKTLAEELKGNMQVPADIVKALANDVSEVAAPMLEFSYVLSEEDLIEIVRATREVPKLQAIARRESISKELTNELVHSGEKEVLHTVLGNSGASMSQETLDYIIEEYYEDHSVLEELVCRGGLPHSYAEKLFSMVSDQLKKQLTKRYRLPRFVADDAVEGAKETAMIQFLSPWMTEEDIEKLVEHMHRNKRLNYSVLLRSLCLGDLRFFEAAMAKLVGVPASNARILLMDPGQLGFNAFYDASPLPPGFRDAVRVLFRVAQEETHYGKLLRDDYAQRVIDRIVAGGYDQEVENMPYLISILRRSKHDDRTIH